MVRWNGPRSALTACSPLESCGFFAALHQEGPDDGLIESDDAEQKLDILQRGRVYGTASDLMAKLAEKRIRSVLSSCSRSRKTRIAQLTWPAISTILTSEQIRQLGVLILSLLRGICCPHWPRINQLSHPLGSSLTPTATD